MAIPIIMVDTEVPIIWVFMGWEDEMDCDQACINVFCSAGNSCIELGSW